MKKTLLISIVVLLSSLGIQAQTIAPFKEGERAVFLGNSITDGGFYHSYIWLYYMTRFPDMKLKMFNAGIGGDTAENMYNRLEGDVLAKKPTTLMLTFGMNDSGYFEYNWDNPEQFAEKALKKSHDNYKKIENRLKDFPEMNVVLLASSPYDSTVEIEGNQPFKGKHETMLNIIDFQKESARENNWEFLDINKPMTEINQKGQKKDPSFTICGNDRIHPDNDGHMVMAYLFLKGQGFEGKEVAKIEVDAKDKKVLSATNCKVSKLKVSPNKVSFDYLAKSLPYPLDTISRGWGNRKSQAQVVDIVPFMEEMNQEMLKINGLQGRYMLRIDGEEVGVWSGEELGKGINLAAETKTPQYQQALKVMHLNGERWEIERRFREYAWVQFNFFKPKGLLDANDREAIEVLDAHKEKDGWLKGRRDIYSKMMFPEVRQAYEDEMELLINTIYKVNKPIKRKIELTKMSGNPLFSGWYADPEGIMFDNKYWIFPTYSDLYDKQLFLDAFSSTDLVNWTKHERIIDNKEVTWVNRAMWAPCVVEKKGKYYIFFGGNDIQNDEHYGGIGIGVADKPEGPYKDYLGKPLIDKIVNGAQPIDQFVFKDKDGSYYMYYGGWGHCNVVKLKDDFTGLLPFEDGSLYKEITPEGYTEGPFMFIKDNKYYFMWSEGGWGGPDYKAAYAISDNPFGPFERVATILEQDSVVANGAGHHSIIHEQKSGKYYIIYHRRPLSETAGNSRATCIEEMIFDKDDFIKPIKMTVDGVEANEQK